MRWRGGHETSGYALWTNPTYALFFGHLMLEKVLKALFAARFDQAPPFSHRLVLLAEKVELPLDQDRLDILEAATDFNLEARYPDEKFSF